MEDGTIAAVISVISMSELRLVAFNVLDTDKGEGRGGWVNGVIAATETPRWVGGVCGVRADACVAVASGDDAVMPRGEFGTPCARFMEDGVRVSTVTVVRSVRSLMLVVLSSEPTMGTASPLALAPLRRLLPDGVEVIDKFAFREREITGLSLDCG